ncbi:MAG: M48 family metalloprotease [Desulfobacteraceae bacterium]|nr:M48 family metalloprotease [Desulfobacteraceae bacterium]MBC2719085.1 M48 family metalloprotease [Desulfobacteraceae bacterium]
MFANFIYFIIVLLIYTTYLPPEEPNFSPVETSLLFLGLIIVFAYFTRMQFHKLEKQIPKDNIFRLDHNINAIITRQSVMAIVLFTINIYGLSLTFFFENIPLFIVIPTLQALVFIGLFVLYLAIIQTYAYGPYKRLYITDLSRRSYVLSNISFSIPVLFPWLLLSGIADIINALPFELPKRFLSIPEGQVIYFLVFLSTVVIIGPAMIQKFWRCKPLESGYVRSRIEKLCKRAGLEYTNILYWPIFGGRMITAGIMGLIKKFRYILITKALVRHLEPKEMDAVIAHEIGHIKRKHLQFYLVFFIGYIFFSYTLFDFLIYFIIYADPVYRLISSSGINYDTIIQAVFSLIIFFIYFRYIFGYFMRNFERQADTYVYALFPSAKPLISTFKKIAATTGQPPDRQNWHHFSIKERIEYLNLCEQDKTYITRHDRKIKKSIAAYLVAIVIIGGIGYNLNYGETGKKLSKHFIEKILLREINKTPDNPYVYSNLGDLYYNINNYTETIRAYEKSIDLKPDNPHVLNNLAWLYATCDDRNLRNPERALNLALKAAKLEESPHILDTLAESYYINSRLEEAISTESYALRIAKKQRSYYEKQLKKLITAAKSGQ